jgi:hypothetical protein
MPYKALSVALIRGQALSRSSGCASAVG